MTRPSASSGWIRALRMAGLTAGVTGSYMGYMLQRGLVSREQGERSRRNAHAKAGRRIREELMVLRGPIMKLGQALSLHTDIVPEELLSELTKLQMEAPGMHPSLAEAQIKGSLGRAPEALFASFERTPFAAASLGQVHRATLHDGTPVAVKIQYPAIREAIAGDFRLFRQAILPARASGHIPKAVIDEIEAQIMLEADYRNEAENIAFFHKALAPLDFVTVPSIYPALSSDRVLTMSLVPGDHIDTFLARRPSQKLRDTVGSRLVDLFYFQLLSLEALHADPHWGNYLFAGDGTLGLVDFGCVKRLGPKVVGALKQSFLYQGDLDSPEFQRIIQAQFGRAGRPLSPASRKAIQAFSAEFYRKVYPPDPERADTPIDFSDAAFLRRYMRASQNLATAKGAAPHYVFLARAEIGLYTTLHKLRARVPMAAIVRRRLAAAAR